MFLRDNQLFLRLIIGVMFGFLSCQIINPDEPIPAFLQVDAIDFVDSTSVNPQKVGIQEFSDAWVYVDNKLQGVYPLPMRAPILQDGVHKIEVVPGILLNGVAATRDRYIFLQGDKQTVNLKADSVTKLSVKTEYESFANFMFVEGFETPTLFFDTTVRSSAAIERIASTDLKGQYIGEVLMDSTSATFDMETKVDYTLGNQNPNPIFLELNYKTTVPINIGFYFKQNGSVSKSSKIILNATSEWNKVYIDVTSDIKSRGKTVPFTIYVSAVKPDNIESAILYFDEIKLVY